MINKLLFFLFALIGVELCGADLTQDQLKQFGNLHYILTRSRDNDGNKLLLKYRKKIIGTIDSGNAPYVLFDISADRTKGVLYNAAFNRIDVFNPQKMENGIIQYYQGKWPRDINVYKMKVSPSGKKLVLLFQPIELFEKNESGNYIYPGFKKWIVSTLDLANNKYLDATIHCLCVYLRDEDVVQQFTVDWFGESYTMPVSRSLVQGFSLNKRLD